MPSVFRLDGPVQEAFPCIDTKEGIRKKEVLSIGELNKFISNSNEQVLFQDKYVYNVIE